MSKKAAPKEATQKKTPAPKQASANVDNQKPLQKALGPAAGDFGVEIKPLGKEIGQLTVRTVRSLLIKPVEKTVWGLEQASSWISEKVSEKLSGVDEGKISHPEPRIALPTLQALIYAGDEEAIRDMFANLLANSMNSDKKSLAHPAFVELIKQMTPSEAELLKFIHTYGPQIRFEIRLMDRKDDGFHTIGYRLSATLAKPTEENQRKSLVSLSNLSRLGLVDLDDMKYSGNPDFDKISEDYLDEFKKLVGEEKAGDLELARCGIYLTALAEQFVQVCLPETGTPSLATPT